MNCCGTRDGMKGGRAIIREMGGGCGRARTGFVVIPRTWEGDHRVALPVVDRTTV